MDFVLFLLLNAVLFIRPAEIVPAMLGWPIYEVCILACLAVSFPRLLHQLTPRVLTAQPVTVCVLGVLIAIILSHATHMLLGLAFEMGFVFAKVVLYFLLFLATVTTPDRLRGFLVALVGMVVILTVIAVMQYHGKIEIEAITTLEEKKYDPETGQFTVIPRLRSTGIYNDPNDLSLILSVGMMASFYFFSKPAVSVVHPHRYSPHGGFERRIRWVWLAPFALFGYALVLTQSRGGLLSFLVGMGVYGLARFGWKKAFLLGALVLPVISVVFAGRQLNIDPTNKGDTAQSRVQLWSDGLMAMRSSPLFGIGMGQYADEMELVAHNSFVHSYTELGFFGGTFFVGAFFLVLRGLQGARAAEGAFWGSELACLRPCLLAIVTSYCAGLWSLSRCYIVPTYMVLGIAAAFLALNKTLLPSLMPSLSGRLMVRLAAVSVAAFVIIHVFVRVMVR